MLYYFICWTVGHSMHILSECWTIFILWNRNFWVLLRENSSTLSASSVLFCLTASIFQLLYFNIFRILNWIMFTFPNTGHGSLIINNISSWFVSRLPLALPWFGSCSSDVLTIFIINCPIYAQYLLWLLDESTVKILTT